MFLRYVTLLLVLPTPHKSLNVGSNWELFHPLSNCDESHSLSFQYHHKHSWDAQVIGGQIEGSLSPWGDHIGSPNSVNNWTLNMFNMFLTSCLFGVVFLMTTLPIHHLNVVFNQEEWFSHCDESCRLSIQFSSKNCRWNVKVIGGQSEESLSLLSDHIGLPNSVHN